MHVCSPAINLLAERLHPTARDHSRWLLAKDVHALGGTGLVTIGADDIAEVLLGNAVGGATKDAMVATAVRVPGADSVERCLRSKANTCRASLICMRNPSSVARRHAQ